MTQRTSSDREHEWQRSNAEANIRCCSGVTLRAACAALGLPASGSKHRLASRLFDVGLTADAVQERYGYRARSAGMDLEAGGA